MLNKLSYGQKKKFLLAFGLACNTQVVLMDEPTNGLDIPSKSVFRKLIASAISEEKVFIISTHQIKDIESIIDGVIILDNGVIKFNNFIDEISDKLKFLNAKDVDNEADVLFSEPNLGGLKFVSKNTDNQHTKPDLEILFNSIVEKNSKVVNYLNN
jgi:ABC-2 type transport system ATP-binding protein